MSKYENNKFVLVKDSKGERFLCPINVGQGLSSIRPDEIDDCVEEDVAGRYAGNIIKKSS